MRIREKGFAIAAVVSLIAFTVLLDLKIEDVVQISWYLVFASSWLGLLVYLVWITRYFFARPMHWRYFTIGTGLVLLFQSVGIPVLLESTVCVTDNLQSCDQRRVWIARIVFIPAVVVELAVLVYLIKDYLWQNQYDEERRAAELKGLQTTADDEWDAEEDFHDLVEETLAEIGAADILSVPGNLEAENAYYYD